METCVPTDISSFQEIRSLQDTNTDNPYRWQTGKFAWSPDGTKIALVNRYDNSDLPLEERASVVDVWEVDSGQLIVTLPINSLSDIESVVWSPDGNWLAASQYLSPGSSVYLWDIERNWSEKRLELPEMAFVRDLIWSPDGTNLALTWISSDTDFREPQLGVPGQNVNIWNVETGELIRTESTNIQAYVISGDENWYIALRNNDILRIQEIDNGEEIFTLNDVYVADAIQNANIGRLVTVHLDPTSDVVQVWDIVSQEELLHIEANAWTGSSLSPNGRYLFSTDIFSEPSNTLWDIISGLQLPLPLSSNEQIRSLSWYPCDDIAAATVLDVSSDQIGAEIRIWNIPTGEIEVTLEGHTGSVYFLAWSPDGTMLASSSDDGTLRIWGIPSTETPTS